LERVSNLELNMQEANKALQQAHERISFLEASLGTGVNMPQKAQNY